MVITGIGWEFVRRLHALAAVAGVDVLPKGAGSMVDSIAAQIVRSGGAEQLEKVSKKHFSTFEKALKGAKS